MRLAEIAEDIQGVAWGLSVIPTWRPTAERLYALACQISVGDIDELRAADLAARAARVLRDNAEHERAILRDLNENLIARVERAEAERSQAEASAEAAFARIADLEKAIIEGLKPSDELARLRRRCMYLDDTRRKHLEALTKIRDLLKPVRDVARHAVASDREHRDNPPRDAPQNGAARPCEHTTAEPSGEPHRGPRAG